VTTGGLAAVPGAGFEAETLLHRKGRTAGFSYRFAWADNGRAVVRESGFVGQPAIVLR
jgi:hypothetical protein